MRDGKAELPLTEMGKMEVGQVLWVVGEIRNPVRDVLSLQCLLDKKALGIFDCILTETSELELKIWEIKANR